MGTYILAGLHSGLDAFEFYRKFPSPCDVGGFYETAQPNRDAAEVLSETFSGLADGPEGDQTWAVVSPFMRGYFVEALFQSEADARQALPMMVQGMQSKQPDAFKEMNLHGMLFMRETVDGSCAELRGQK